MGKQKILIYGGSGLVGSEIVKLLAENFILIAPTHTDVDLTNAKQIKRNIDETAPDQIIYATGITKVDLAEKQPELAFMLNSEAPKIIAEIAASNLIPVHYLSTNAVFDGTQSDRPYREDDKPNPVSIYGKSKLEGEKHVLNASRSHCVLRTIMPYSSFYPKKEDFARVVLESLEQGKQVAGIVDQIINPIYVKTLARAIKKILTKRAGGIYHLAAADWMSNAEFVQRLIRTFNYSKDLIIPTTLEKFYQQKSGPRTPYYWLDTKKFHTDFGAKILHSIDDDLRLFRRDYVSSHTSTNTGRREAISEV